MQFSETQFHIGTIGSSGRPVVFHLPSNMWFEFDAAGVMGFHDNPTWKGDREALFIAARAFADKYHAKPQEFSIDLEERKVLHTTSGIWFRMSYFEGDGVSFRDNPSWRGDRMALAAQARAFAIANGIVFKPSTPVA